MLGGTLSLSTPRGEKDLSPHLQPAAAYPVRGGRGRTGRSRRGCGGCTLGGPRLNGVLEGYRGGGASPRLMSNAEAVKHRQRAGYAVV